jgi:hypothetical protein
MKSSSSTEELVSPVSEEVREWRRTPMIKTMKISK